MHKILYVDDESLNLTLFQINLGNRYQVLTAENGPAAFEVMKENPGIKAVISDMKMPFMTGIEFIKKATELYPDIPYFIMTGYAINEDIKDALDQGLIKKYMNKPFQMQEIIDNLESAIK